MGRQLFQKLAKMDFYLCDRKIFMDMIVFLNQRVVCPPLDFQFQIENYHNMNSIKLKLLFKIFNVIRRFRNGILNHDYTFSQVLFNNIKKYKPNDRKSESVNLAIMLDFVIESSKDFAIIFL